MKLSWFKSLPKKWRFWLSFAMLTLTTIAASGAIDSQSTTAVVIGVAISVLALLGVEKFKAVAKERANRNPFNYPR